jgi:NTE family protein
MNEIALALGGGGVKGLAHIGVIRTLEKEGFQIKAISGTSAGGIVGCLYAAGYSPDEIENSFSMIEPSSKTLARDPGDEPSLLGLHGLAQALIKLLPSKTFSDLSIPFACTAVDIQSGQEITLNRGSVAEAIMGSVAVPGIFPPKILGPFTLIDGGVLDPVPVAVARWLAPGTPIVAVCLTPPASIIPPTHITNIPANATLPITRPLIEKFARLRVAQAFQIFTRSIDIGTTKMADLRLEVDRPEVIIRPDVSDFGLLDHVKPEEIIQIGEQATKESLQEIGELFSWHRKVERKLLTRRFLPPGVLLPSSESQT